MAPEVVFKNTHLGCLGCVGTEVWLKNTALTLSKCLLSVSDISRNPLIIIPI